MNTLTVYEYDVLVESSGQRASGSTKLVPKSLFQWLQTEAVRLSESGENAWLRLSQRHGRPAVRLMNYVGVIRSPDGFQLEVLPKIGKTAPQPEQVRALLIEMLRCLAGFRFIKTDRAALATAKMPLLEVFISEFLSAMEHLVKRGVRSDYVQQQDNLQALRGKLLISQHLQANLVRKDRFYTEHEEFTPDRPVNRLLHLALLRVMSWSLNSNNQKRARELSFIFSNIPLPSSQQADLQRMRVDRGMEHYRQAVAWMRLILGDMSPLTGAGKHSAFSLLFPMEAVFEAYVGKHLSRQLREPYCLRTQARSFSLVKHRGKNWFRLKPDFLVDKNARTEFVLDTKWKLLDSALDNGSNKYGLSQGDFYQLFAYGENYLKGQGDVVLIYPKTDTFQNALPVFEFSSSLDLRLWVLPFCLMTRRLVLPEHGPLSDFASTALFLYR